MGSLGRVHYLWQVKAGANVAVAACRGASGTFTAADDDAWVTCPKCRQLERDRTVPKTERMPG